MLTLRELGSLLWRAPRCARCGDTMALRLNNRERTLFWGCSSWPKCHQGVPFIFQPPEGYQRVPQRAVRRCTTTKKR